MTLTTTMVVLIIGCALVTIIPRILPFIFVKKLQLPDVVLKWLSFIPVCILTALVVQSVVNVDADGFVIDQSVILVLIPTIAVAILTKSLSITVITGVGFMAVVRLFFS
ncbi:branched-chain amino acid transporter AzlD [Alkalihalobacillus alcalophilus ATCC 27647 = CGMCC 1.3604]|uniref:Branched-chain amino acid transporter AzlD n=1 Tax=Alkalihalobacillus alcalophilus ATCC 27647 = CGMCC 1.3604 TaxID=1218173 RepID=A0A094WGW3_ALKAL|nr:AzlD domain-containing protein [Alkalihalobacillus alcalophilus]KGA96026.1 branched-chain amino acid transporter AzlD [Alkalihalobacillus alcalophilus ATCC 27647 = CGMCC 1.3604]MED1561289.1 AzlD domain-containing protein [Alkalihalobacillus alcalophilus]THG91874.1 branched-chain amino acid transporter AzlD [Alkalihalobacillus alcalophilus ATCC 27647 = CGMCC 1.3604]